MIFAYSQISLKFILDDSQISLKLILRDSCQFLILTDSWWFLVILTDSHRFSNKSGIDSHWFLNKNPDYHWFLLILNDSRQFLMILNDSWISLKLILIDSRQFSVILNDSGINLKLIFGDSQINLKLILIDSRWLSDDSWIILKLILIDSHRFLMIHKSLCNNFGTNLLHHFTQQISVNIFFIFLFLLLQPQFLTNYHKQGAILKLRISFFQPCINYDDSHDISTDLHQLTHANHCKSVWHPPDWLAIVVDFLLH